MLIFVSDALRWDYTPKFIREQGITFKGVASSLHTASAFPSIMTGLYPHHHKVYSFLDTIPNDIPTLLQSSGYNTSLWCGNTWTKWEPKGYSQIHDILRFDNPQPLEDILPPFIYVEDEKGGHCPYGWEKDGVYDEDDCVSFFRDYSQKNVEKLRESYKKGIERSLREFRERMEVLKNRGLLEETLIIFLSDHGELLGEYGGLVGHGRFTTPEVVYVPITLMHPQLPRGKSFEHEGVVRHIDLFPTLLDLLNIETPNYEPDGVSLLKCEKLPRFGLTYYKTSILGHEIVEKSIWDKGGGYVIREGSKLFRLMRVLYMTCFKQNTLVSIYLRGKLRNNPLAVRNYLRIFKIMSSSSFRFGLPHFDLTKAKERIAKAEKLRIRQNAKHLIKERISSLKSKEKI